MNKLNEYIYPLRVQIEDIDFQGVVYHVNYLKYMERARSEWLEDRALGIEWQKNEQFYFTVHSVNISFLKPARLHEKVEVVTSFKSIRPASLTFDQYLRPAGSTDKIFCKAEVKIACVDFEMRPRALPDIPFLETIRRELT